MFARPIPAHQSSYYQNFLNQASYADYLDLKMKGVILKYLHHVAGEVKRDLVKSKSGQEDQFDKVYNYLMCSTDFLLPHQVFAHLEDTVDSDNIIKNVLSYLSNLPADNQFKILNVSFDGMFKTRLQILKNPRIYIAEYQKLSDETIRTAITASLSAREGLPVTSEYIDAFAQSLIAIRDYHINSLKRFQIKLQKFLDKQDRSAIDHEVSNASSIPLAEMLDAKFNNPEAFKVVMLNYIFELVKAQKVLRKYRSDLIKDIVGEIRGSYSRVTLAHYNMQMGMPLKHVDLLGLFRREVFPREKRPNGQMNERQKEFYYVQALTSFSYKFPDLNLTKDASVKVFYKLLNEIGERPTNTIVQKLIEYQVLFDLAGIYLNSHREPEIDDFFGIENTTTWRNMTHIVRKQAWAELLAAGKTMSHDAYLELLTSAKESSLFNQHRNRTSYMNTLFADLGATTDTVKKIEDEILAVKENVNSIVDQSAVRRISHP
jgi:hypothetical protein